MPGPGLISVNLPATIPPDARDRIKRVPLAIQPMPMRFERADGNDGRMEFSYAAPYWKREVPSPTDYSTIREGDIAITTIPLYMDS